MKMLVVVDYQNDFVNGSLGFAGAEKLDAPIAAKIREYITNGDLVVQTKDTHPSVNWYMNSRECKHLPVHHCWNSSHGWKTYGETGKAIEAIETNIHQYNYVTKETFGCSPSAMVDIQHWVTSNCFALCEDKSSLYTLDTIEFVGLVSNICVISNMCVFQAAFPDAQIVVDPTLIASHDPELHEAVLKVMKGLQVEFI